MRLLSWYPRYDGYGWEKGAWIRLGTNGPGVVWTREPPRFSEREGIRRPFLRVRGWRFFWLAPLRIEGSAFLRWWWSSRRRGYHPDQDALCALQSFLLGPKQRGGTAWHTDGTNHWWCCDRCGMESSSL